ncbi:nitroreductase [Kutzneria sp. NPDC052558]|uniref:nitroreductase n=1 Tax=Kutzneria sp. NPDC052558 TaxID=3364121 RepID=UPI0037C6EFCD
MEPIRARQCKRAYLDRPVPTELLADVLEAAAMAPSTRNGQPWRIEVVTADARRRLAARLVAEFDRGVPTNPDYRNRGIDDPATKARAADAIAGVLRARGLTSRRQHLRDNLGFYGAPVELILHLAADAPPGWFLEAGFFLQNVMLGLVSAGLGSCPQFSVAGYPDVVREVLGLGPERLIVCGLAVGYPDESAAVNGFRPPRAPLGDYVRWHGQAPLAADTATG